MTSEWEAEDTKLFSDTDSTLRATLCKLHRMKICDCVVNNNRVQKRSSDICIDVLLTDSRFHGWFYGFFPYSS